MKNKNIKILYDLLFVCERLYWKNDIGNKTAQDLIDEIHNEKYGSKEGFFVQAKKSIDYFNTK